MSVFRGPVICRRPNCGSKCPARSMGPATRGEKTTHKEQNGEAFLDGNFTAIEVDGVAQRLKGMKRYADWQ